MAGKYFFVDTTRCMACRGCQVACKEWNKLPATKTHQWGSPQNSPDLDANTYRLVRFREYLQGQSIVRYFFTDACRHCLDPSCKAEADGYVDGAIIIDKTGAVLFTEKTKELGENAQYVIDACPFNIPRLNSKTGLLAKCHMCFMRIQKGIEPMCSKACPTDALNFGNNNDMIKLAKKRLDQVKNRYGDKAQLIDPDEVRVIYLIVDNPEKYYEFAAG